MQQLEDGTITLLPLDASYADAFIRLANEPTISEAVNNPQPYEQRQFNDLLEQIAKQKKYFVWMISCDGSLCGAINSAARLNPHAFQGGYWIDPEWRGKGIGTKAQVLVRDFLINECEAIRIQALVEPSNMSSMRVLEKCGFEKEGLMRRFYPTLRRGLVDVLMYSYIAK
jgi:[ribosomal protein S5]-alanine N-acetyltransferase